MELHQLLSFVSVADEGNLTRAARKRHISQSSLSAQIKSLEDSLDLVLFSRTPKGMQLTEDGQSMLTHARAVLRAADMMKSAATTMKHKASSVLVGLNIDPTFLRMTQLEAIAAQNYSHMRLRFLPSQTMITTEMLQDKIIDAGFRFGFSNHPDIHDICVAQTPLRVVVPIRLLPEGARAESYSPGWAELAALPWIWGDCMCPMYDEANDKMRQHGVSPNIAVEAVDERIIREHLLSGRGAAIMRLEEAQELADQGAAVLCRKELSTPLCLAHLASRKNEPAIQAFAQIVAMVWGSNSL